MSRGTNSRKRGRGERKEDRQFTTLYLRLVAQVTLDRAKSDIEISAVKERDHYQLPRKNPPNKIFMDHININDNYALMRPQPRKTNTENL
ncbi:hypothetical protein PoB_006055800 [Plakobranchus ocellatus]|uniref:Uncharacterized protein n=1 Tax=Plakobranchus ocellatus TaxID=259542 RepID=A0AAV4CQ93_9GAST|nr:hypothetical protein PoB_006055800 [Plakobranchus ocellatus]